MGDLIQDFMNLFSRRYDCFVKRDQMSPWRPMSRYHHLSDAEVLSLITGKADSYKACRLDDLARFVVLRVSNDELKTNKFIQDFRTALAELDARPAHYEFLGDWYFYIFFTAEVAFRTFESDFESWLARKGLPLSAGEFEILGPHSAVPIPLQPGFTWMNEEGHKVIRSGQMTFEEGLRLFIADTKVATCPDKFVEHLEQEFELRISECLESKPEEQPIVIPEPETWQSWDQIDCEGTRIEGVVVFGSESETEAQRTDELTMLVIE